MTLPAGIALTLLLAAVGTAHAQTTLVSPDGKCLDVNGPEFDARRNGARVQSWDCHGGPNQRWQWRGAAVVAGNGKCLEVHGDDFNGHVDGGRVQLWDCHGGANQRWRLQGNVLVAAHGKCLDLYGPEFESRVNGGRVLVWNCHSGANQQWNPGDAQSPAPPSPVAPIPPQPPPSDPFDRFAGWTIERGTDRSGGDYRNFELDGRPGGCRVACAADARCAAFVHVAPSPERPRAHCWLKSVVTAPTPSPTCTTGVKQAGATARVERVAFTSTFEAGIDHPGADYADFDMIEPRPEVCQAACEVDVACAAWAYGVPSRRSPRPHCWLKSAAPPSVRHRFRVSGVKPGAPPPVVVVPAPPPVVVPPPPALPPSTPFRRDVPPAPIVVAPPPAPVVVAAPPSPMADLGSLVAAIRGEAFSQAKLGVLGDAARAHWFSVDQVKQLLGLFAFSPDKLSALRLLAPRLVDPQNRYQIYSAFTFSSDKEEARQILGQ